MKLSLVIPSYNEKDNIHFIYGQIINCHLEKIITSFSTRPVKFSFMIGLFVIILGLIYAIYSFFNFFFGHATPGWTSLMIVLLLLGGIQLLSIRIIGEYISLIFNESKRRPHYFFQDRC